MNIMKMNKIIEIIKEMNGKKSWEKRVFNNGGKIK